MNAARPPGRLFVVSTPIGNMGDFSFRAVEVLRSAAVVLAEDTRHSRSLLDRYEVRTPTLAYHEHNEARMTPTVIERLQGGENIALISDAGTPLLSDPGARLVRGAIDAGVDVVPIPGASALLAALVASGLDATRFTFFGFLPRKGRDRREAIGALVDLAHTAVLYEAPARVADTLAELAAAGAGGRQVAVAREMTKRFEEVRRGTVGELAAYYKNAPARGEVVIVLAGGQRARPSEDEMRKRARELRAEGVSVRDATAALIKEFGVGRNEGYRLAREDG
ncbi:MAG: 16S rRNA (cytidine(1402)-2'-O)-methyltransferase [Gemmatimonadota bacterium]|nr:16S rRNA (cytidine(1402)-2'-O)-methyltransferase [Gemmatimonadota bacterium]